MSPAELVGFALAAHGTAALLALGGGLARYSERADIYAKVMQETDALLRRMRQQITAALERELADLFADYLSGTPTLIVGTTASPTYGERPLNPLGSDQFTECLRAFVDSNATSLADYRDAARAHRWWCSWARIRRWDVYLLTVWELLCVAVLGVVHRMFGVAVSDVAIGWLFLPTGLLIIAFLICEWGLLQQQDVFDAQRSRYPDH